MRTFAAAFVGGIVGTAFTSVLAVAWTGPVSAPPSGNVAPPINVGDTAQVKNGGLSVNQLAVFGNGTLIGNFGVRTTSPAYPLDVNGGSRIVGNLLLFGASRYLNFGTATSSAGYGIRDNAGVMQFKNNGGAWTNIGASSGASIPAGAIMAFDLIACPSGWSEYTQARGRFLRGIDNGAGNDPSGTRAPGTIQQDAFQGHKHFSRGTLTYVGDSGAGVDDGPGWPRNQYANSAGTYDAGYGAPRISTETRPKNVAVLFCRKN